MAPIKGITLAHFLLCHIDKDDTSRALRRPISAVVELDDRTRERLHLRLPSTFRQTRKPDR